jgi:large subunit ribosomal protein L3
MAVPGILGKKLGMTQMFAEDGTVVPVTVLKAGPCVVVQRKTAESDGYEAVQLGLVEFIKPRRVNKPRTGHLKKNNIPPLRFLRELRLEDGKSEAKAGNKVLVEELFKANDKVDVIGVSKGQATPGSSSVTPSGGQDARPRCSTARRGPSAPARIPRASGRASAWPGRWATRGLRCAT